MRRRYLRRRGAVLWNTARIRRPISGIVRYGREVYAADARQTRRRGVRYRRQTRLCADPVNSRTAHSTREGYVKHMHKPGPLRADGDDLPGHDGPARYSRGRAAERTESPLCRLAYFWIARVRAPVQGALLQRVRDQSSQEHRRCAASAAPKENDRGAASRSLLSRAFRLDAGLCYGDGSSGRNRSTGLRALRDLITGSRSRKSVNVPLIK